MSGGSSVQHRHEQKEHESRILQVHGHGDMSHPCQHRSETRSHWEWVSDTLSFSIPGLFGSLGAAKLMATLSQFPDSTATWAVPARSLHSAMEATRRGNGAFGLKAFCSRFGIERNPKTRPGWVQQHNELTTAAGWRK